MAKITEFHELMTSIGFTLEDLAARIDAHTNEDIDENSGAVLAYLRLLAKIKGLCDKHGIDVSRP